MSTDEWVFLRYSVKLEEEEHIQMLQEMKKTPTRNKQQ